MLALDSRLSQPLSLQNFPSVTVIENVNARLNTHGLFRFTVDLLSVLEIPR